MNPQTFFDHFERLTDAPNAVARLRELILQLAVQGKLVAQDERDEPAARLLERIATERKRLVREKKIREVKPLPPVVNTEVPFELPNGWAWTRLGGLAKASDYGTSEKALEFMDAVPVLRMNNINGGKIIYESLKYLPITIDDLPRLYLKHNDLLFNRTNSYELVGKTGVYKGESDKMTFASYLIRLSLFSDYLDVDFVNLVMNSVYFRKYQIEPNLTQQNGQANFNGTKLSLTFIPLPPLTEQKRIVAKVDELMRLCDELERRQAERREARSSLNRAVLDQLLAASGAAEFQARWRTVRDQFTTLTATPDLIGKLRQTVLQLAVQGKLTRQDPQDKPATSLLRRIRAEKERLVKEKRLRSADPFPLVNSDETPFDLPNGWVWTRFGDVTINRDGERVPIEKSIREHRQGKYDYYGASGVIDKFDDYIFDKSLLLIGEDGANLINRSTPIAFIAHGKYWVNNHAHVLDSISLDCLKYLELYINATDLRPYITGTAQPKMNQAKMNLIAVAVPPVEEQKRIVAAVNRLMMLCDELEANLRRAEEDGERLLRAAVRSMLASASEISAAEADALVVQ